MKLTPILMIITSLVVVSCDSTYRIDEKLLKINPYSVGEKLVFRSNTMEYDTVKINELVKNKPVMNYGVGLFKKRSEGFSVTANHSIPSIDSLDKTQKGSIFMMNNYGNGTILSFWFAGVNKRSALSRSITIDSFLSLNMTTLKLHDRTFNDVVIIETDTIYTTQYHDRIDRVCWSLQYGYLKIRVNNSKEWTLVDKIEADEI